MAQMIDLIGSSIIAGLLLVSALSLNASVTETTMLHNRSLLMQQEATFMTEMMDRDLNNVGYRDSSSTKIRAATATSLVFRADVNNNGVPDTVGYFYTTGSQVATILSTWHCLPQSLPVGPNDTILFRFSTAPEGALPGGTPTIITTTAQRFQFSYMDTTRTSLGSTPASLKSIRYIRISAELINRADGYDTLTTPVQWEKVYRPKNLSLH